MNLSFVLGGRDDNYGEFFIERLHRALEENIKAIHLLGLQEQVEIIVVDYNPLEREKWLCRNPMLVTLLSDKIVKNIIVDNSVIVEEKLNKTKYYEYFAKNVGIIESKGKFLVITNSDIVYPRETIFAMNEILNKNSTERIFYRCRYRRSINLNDPLERFFLTTGTPNGDLHVPSYADAVICGHYSGDATMFTRSSLLETATGYDETNPGHRGDKSQSNMDGEILWNLHNQGFKMQFIEHPYYHIEHGRPSPRDGVYNSETYKNPINKWGCQQYQRKTLGQNIIGIYK